MATGLYAFVKSHRTNTEKDVVSSRKEEISADQEKLCGALGNGSNGNSWLEKLKKPQNTYRDQSEREQ